MDHTAHTLLQPTELTEANLMGAVVYGAGDERIGTISHIHGMGAGLQLILDVGGFLGIGTKPVAVNGSELKFMRDEDGDIHATSNWTKDQVKAFPEHHH